MLRGIQIMLARLAIGWTQQKLADTAKLGVATIRRAEGAKSKQPRLTYSNVLAIRRTLEGEGIIFIEDDANPGVRWRSHDGTSARNNS
jgi:transcriptional regulator with XRE-family HTH domain